LNSDFWRALDRLISESEIVIDRPKNSHHPKYHDMIYPLDYGYLKDTRSMDGQGIDVWRGSLDDGKLKAIMVIVDLWKKDSEIKLLIGVTDEEAQTVYAFHNNNGDAMQGILIPREEPYDV
jgi:inorganic pyrophosphatase